MKVMVCEEFNKAGACIAPVWRDSVDWAALSDALFTVPDQASLNSVFMAAFILPLAFNVVGFIVGSVVQSLGDGRR